jgi:peptidyl-Asp metalloendopeptidase
MTNAGDSCGIAYFDVIAIGITLGSVQRSCSTGYYSFAHEIAHMYGAMHNREVSTNPTYATAYGYLMRPPINSTFRTIMA